MNEGVGAGKAVVALTGANGFIGSALREQLIAAGYGVRALYRPHPGRVVQDAAGLKWVAGSVDDQDALADLMDGAEVVVHCAGAVRGARRSDFDEVNETGVLETVAAANREAGCRRFLLFSSLAAREPQLSDYAGSKRRGERALQTNAGRLDWAVLRPPAVYGPGDREMLPLFQGMARGLVPIPGDGGGRFSLIHVADLAAAVVAWLETDGDSENIYALDDGHKGGYDWDTLIATASRVLRDNAPIRRLPISAPILRLVGGINLAAARVLGYAPMLTPGKVRELTHEDWVCDGSAFTQATGWRPVFDFERGLVNTLGERSLH